MSNSIPTLIDADINKAESAAVTSFSSTPQKLAAKESLCQRFGLVGEFVRAGQVAAILGIADGTVRALVREGACPIAHRRFGRSLLFKLDDFVDWYCEGGVRDRAPEASSAIECETPAPRAKARLARPIGDDAPKPFPPPLGETPAQRSERIGRDVRAAMAERRRAQSPK